jgi:nitronate monooxygenase
MPRAASPPTLSALLGTRWPLLQAPMAGAQGSEMAIAVSEAGGLGALPAAMLSLESLRAELGAMKSQTARPYNLNFFCHPTPAPDAAREAHWRQTLAPYFAELDLDPAATLPAPARAPFSAEAAALVEEFKPPVVSFHFGLPDAALLARVRACGATVLACATTLEEGRWLQDRGVDAVIAQGLEAGGHRGMFLSDEISTQLGTVALVPQLVRALRVPVIAAGGIADAQGVAAALALGAAGVQVGTAYLLCPEARITPLHRAALQSEAAQHTALTRLFSGRPARGIVNRLMRELGPMNPAAPAFPLAGAALAPLRAQAESRGCSDFSPLWSGQNASACRTTKAAEVTRALAEGL